MKGIIYSVVNTTNNQIYIGATCDTIHQRKLDHTERAKRGEKGKFHEAISTYGVDAFKWEQIDTANSINELAHKESKYILEYKTKEEGMNSDRGGGLKKIIYLFSVEDGSLERTFDSLEDAAAEFNTTKQQISMTCLSVNQMYRGFFWSYHYSFNCQSIKDKRRKDVIQLDLDENIIARYKSVADASREAKISKTCIARVCRGEREKSGGFIWRYIDTEELINSNDRMKDEDESIFTREFRVRTIS